MAVIDTSCIITVDLIATTTTTASLSFQESIPNANISYSIVVTPRTAADYFYINQNLSSNPITYYCNSISSAQQFTYLIIGLLPGCKYNAVVNIVTSPLPSTILYGNQLIIKSAKCAASISSGALDGYHSDDLEWTQGNYDPPIITSSQDTSSPTAITFNVSAPTDCGNDDITDLATLNKYSQITTTPDATGSLQVLDSDYVSPPTTSYSIYYVVTTGRTQFVDASYWTEASLTSDSVTYSTGDVTATTAYNITTDNSEPIGPCTAYNVYAVISYPNDNLSSPPPNLSNVDLSTLSGYSIFTNGCSQLPPSERKSCENVHLIIWLLVLYIMYRLIKKGVS